MTNKGPPLNICHSKNIFSNIESNMAPPETSGSTTAKLEHPKTDEEEEKDLKNKFMGVLEPL